MSLPSQNKKHIQKQDKIRSKDDIYKNFKNLAQELQYCTKCLSNTLKENNNQNFLT